MTTQRDAINEEPTIKGLPTGGMLMMWRRIYQEFMIRIQRWGLPSNVCFALLYIYRNPEKAEPATIAEAHFIPRQTITFIIDTLEQKKWAVRKPHPNDRRRIQIKLTAAGRRMAKKIFNDLRQFEINAFSAIDSSQVDLFYTMLDRYTQELVQQNGSDATP